MLPETSDPGKLASAMAALAERAVTETWERHRDELDYSTESLDWIEELIGEYDSGLNVWPGPEASTSMAILWGAYVGEVMRRHGRGEWVRSHGTPALRLGGVTVFPVDKVRKRLSEGPGHNLVSFCGLFLDLSGGGG